MKRLDLDIDHLVREYNSGRSLYSLSKKIGVARCAIEPRLRAAGVEIRSRSAAGLLRAGRMTSAERKAQTNAANRATRGRPANRERLRQAARTRERRQIGISKMEHTFARLLQDRGVSFVQQLAIGTYNCDFAVHPVAVEIFGGSWHWYGEHIAGLPKRFRKFFDAGWHILVVTDYGGVPIEGATADYVVSYIEQMRADPTRRREYRVIRGAGQLLAAGCEDDAEISIVPAFTTTRNPTTGQYQSVPRNAPAV